MDEMKQKGYIPRKYDFQVIEVVVQQTENAFG